MQRQMVTAAVEQQRLKRHIQGVATRETQDTNVGEKLEP